MQRTGSSERTCGSGSAAGGGRARLGADRQGVRRECCQRLAVWLVASGLWRPCKPAVRKPASLPPRRIPQRRSRPERKAVRLACAAFRLVSPVHSHAGLGALGAQTATAQGASPQRWHRGPCPTPRRCKDC